MAPKAQQAKAKNIRDLCDYIRANCQSGEPMLLQALSKRAGVSPFHLQRTFTEAVGVSPKQFVQACRIEALKTNLQVRPSVTEAIYESGFASSSRVYEQVDAQLGMTPSLYRAKGKDLEISYVVVTTPLGPLLIAATDRGLCSVQFGDSEPELAAKLRAEYQHARLSCLAQPYSPLIHASIAALQRYLRGEDLRLNLPLDVRATAFQAKVWRYLQAIPAGEIRSYTQVAQAVGLPKAVRAVAHACASNQLALVIPCHRVIRGDGKLGGYRWGLHRKAQLLDGERSQRPDSAPVLVGEFVS